MSNTVRSTRSKSAWLLAGTLTLATMLSASSSAPAQGNRGFARTAPAQASNEEIVRQPDVWMMEVQIKPMRMTWVDITDPKNNEVTKRQEIWYLVWRAITRPIQGRVTSDIEPVNEPDPLPGPPQFIPEFTLITYDNPETEIPVQTLTDEILPEAVRQIETIERQRLANTVEVVQNVPGPVAPDADSQPWIYGVATWRGVDPDTDFFKVILEGFSNAYQIKSADNNEPQAWRKVLIQRFKRPGDRFDPNLKEFQFDGSPTWIYRPDSAPKSSAQSAVTTDTRVTK